MILLHEGKWKRSHTYWSRLITLSPSSLISVLVAAIYDGVDGDGGGGLLMLTCADFSEASAINALICSSLQFSPSYTTLEIKATFKASESTRKCLKEKTPESLPISERNRETPIENKEKNGVLMPSSTLKLWNSLTECNALMNELGNPRGIPEDEDAGGVANG